MLRVNQYDWDEGEVFTHVAVINFSARYLSNSGFVGRCLGFVNNVGVRLLHISTSFLMGLQIVN